MLGPEEAAGMDVRWYQLGSALLDEGFGTYGYMCVYLRSKANGSFLSALCTRVHVYDAGRHGDGGGVWA